MPPTRESSGNRWSDNFDSTLASEAMERIFAARPVLICDQDAMRIFTRSSGLRILEEIRGAARDRGDRICPIRRIAQSHRVRFSESSGEASGSGVTGCRAQWRVPSYNSVHSKRVMRSCHQRQTGHREKRQASVLQRTYGKDFNGSYHETSYSGHSMKCFCVTSSYVTQASARFAVFDPSLPTRCAFSTNERCFLACCHGRLLDICWRICFEGHKIKLFLPPAALPPFDLTCQSLGIVPP
jgi:hypothetical protein